jgi:hypothetical protein
MEQGVSQLPVPQSATKAAFVLQFLSGPLPARQAPPTLRLKEIGRRKVAMAFALAAGLAFCALGMWAWTNRPAEGSRQHSSTPTLAQRTEQLQLRLVTARTPTERVQCLADMADEVLGEARTQLADAGRVDEVARFYAQLIGEHLLSHARAMPRAECAALLPGVAERLGRAESEASRLAVELDAQNRLAAASFRQIALAASDGNRRLLALSRGEPA